MAHRSLASRPLLLEYAPLFKWVDKDTNVYIHKYKVYQWDLYAIGYKYAADLAIEQGIQEHRLDFIKYHNSYHTVDVLVWPAIYLYRQYLELRLKSIMIRAGMLKLCEDGEYPSEDFMEFNATHKIDELWKDCKTLLKKFYSEPDAEDLEELKTMDKYIDEFSKFDENSFKTRYPASKPTSKKEGKPWEYEKVQFSLINLKLVMDNIYSYLEDQNNSLDSAVDYEKECLRESFSYSL